ncbi:MAG: fasciclin domain-containing protein [Mameliella sp.]|nr:fasciclin domain-containing protein [Phaeodactylibacter sp.]
MKNCFALVTTVFALALLWTPLQAQHSRQVKMNPGKDIVEVAVSSKVHTTLVAAVQAADLVETLQTPGPFTVFAPVNAAFEKLPEGTVATLLLEENKAQLQSILTYHVVAGKITAEKVVAAIKAGNGTAVLTTVNGAELRAVAEDSGVYLIDANGNRAQVIQTDLDATNGVIHVIDTVVMP